MDIRVLGPVEVRDGGGSGVPLGGAQQRCVAGLLAAHLGGYVSVERLSEALWDDEPPKTAKTIVQGHVSQLRKAAGDLIDSGAAGYALAVPADRVDLGRFRRLAAEGRAAARPADAARAWSRALDEWRGQPLQGIGGVWVDQRVRGPLLEERWALLEEYAAALAELGRHHEVPVVLRELRHEQPFRERPHELAMVALWHGGRAPEALELFREVRRLFADELGVDPGPRLRDLHASILSGAPPPSAGRVVLTTGHPQTTAPGSRAPGPPVLGSPASGSSASSLSASTSPASGSPAPAGGRVVPRQLPMETAGFAGRRAELDRLCALLRERQIVLVTGAAGAGKSALAVRAGHRLAAEFPDGQLHVDLNGYGQGDPVPPERALTRCLRALGVGSVPAGATEQADLYRSLTAGRRLLVVLDNAANAGQVRPLLPGGTGCAVIVTSRDSLRGLVALEGARSLTLGTLTPVEARDLLADVAGPDRIGAEPGAVAEMAGLCGHLPLALRIAGANLAARPGLGVESYTAELRADRWRTLSVEGDPQAAVATAFGRSYASLAPGAALLFRRFGLAPGCDFTVATASRLAGADAATAARLLGALASAHLIEEHAPGRFRLHDLIHLYARERRQPDDEPGRTRLHAYYLHTARAAAALLAPANELLPLTAADPPLDAEPLDDPSRARAWLDAEQHNLLAVLDQAIQLGAHRMLWRLIEVLRAFMNGRVHLEVIVSLARAGLRAAEQAGDTAGQGSMHHTLGNARLVLNDPHAAIAHYERASAHYEDIGWTPGVLMTLTNLATAGTSRGDLAGSTRHYERVIRVWEKLEPSAKLAATLENHALALLWQGRAGEALEQQRRAIDLFLALGGSRSWRGRAYAILGDVHLALGDLGAAEEAFGVALGGEPEFGSRFREAAAYGSLAMTHYLRGEVGAAVEQARRAVEATRGRGVAGEHDEALSTLAWVDETADLDARCALLERVVASYAERGAHPYPKARAHLLLATLRQRAGTSGEAGRRVSEALALARAHGLRRLEGQALTLSARLPEGAAGDALRAAELHRELGHRLDEADAMLAAAACLVRDGRPDEAAPLAAAPAPASAPSAPALPGSTPPPTRGTTPPPWRAAASTWG
ncbi:AfsR/SARP family transcriptional regulator [Nonomuraea sp. NPDC003214]